MIQLTLLDAFNNETDIWIAQDRIVVMQVVNGVGTQLHVDGLGWSPRVSETPVQVSALIDAANAAIVEV